MAETKKKKTATTKKKATTAKKKPTKKKSASTSLSAIENHRNVVMLTYLLSGALLLCFALIKGSNIWSSIRGGLFSFFGITLYLFAAFLIVIGIELALNSFKKSFAKTNFSYASIVISISAFIHLCTNSAGDGGFADWKANFFSCVSEGWEMGTGAIAFEGGILGAVFGGFPLLAFGKAGAFIIVTVCLIVSILYAFNVSVHSVAELVSKLINSGKDGLDKTGEKTKIRIDERKRERQKLREKEELRRKREQEEAEVIVDSVPEPKKDSFDFDDTEIEDYPTISGTDSGRRKLTPYQPEENIFTIPDKRSTPEKVGVFERKFDDGNMISGGEGDSIPADAFGGSEIITDETLPDDFIEIIDDDFDDALEPLDEETDAQGAELSDKDKKIVEDAADTADAKQAKNKHDVETYVEAKPKKEYILPPIDCLNEAKFGAEGDSADEMRITARKLVDVLQSFGVETKLIGVSRGPSVTRYELSPAPGVKISKITNLADDIALGLASSGVRIEAPIPNKSAVGIEVPNKTRATVTMREMIASEEYISNKNKNKLLNVALGKDITGNITCADLSKMPHLLIAGTTGSGKSVCLNVMIASILYNATPAQVKLLMIDPKQVEFTVYNGIPHLLVPVISDARKAAGSLAWAVGEMDARYKTFSSCAVRDIGSYNKYAEEHPELNLQYMPQIVIFIDELNDLMMVSPKEVEDSICRLAQKARAAGMHLVVATQRPSVDVITGIIKANIPSRISLSVSSQVDSRTILDSIGAEKLLGNGDMLFNPVGMSKPVRIQGAYLSDAEIEKIVTFIKDQEKADYDDGIMEEIEKNAVVENNNKKKSGGAEGVEESQYDVLIEEAMNIITGMDSASTTVLQRKLSVGYARAARIMDQLEQLGYISPAEGNKPRRVLVTRAQYLERCASNEDTSSSDDYDILSD